MPTPLRAAARPPAARTALAWMVLAICAGGMWPGAVPAAAAVAPEPGALSEAFRVELDAGARAAIQPPHVEVTGGVTAYHGDTVIRAQELHYDDEQKLAVFTGEVELRQPQRRVRGERLTYHLQQGRAVVDGAVAQESAPGLPGPISLRTPRLEATRALAAAPAAELTTCPLPFDQAHYRVRVARLEVEPGQWVRAWHAVLYDTGIPIYYWPYLQFSLRNPRAGQFGPPEVGSGAREGWYVRGRVPYLGPGEQYGYVLLDYYQRLGPGVGLQHALYDDGDNWLAGTVRFVPNPSGQVPDLRLGVQAEGRPGGGTGHLRLQGGRWDQFGALVQEGDLQARAQAPDWGLELELDGQSRQVQGVAAGPPPPAPGQWLQGRLRLRPPGQGPWRLTADGRWDINTIDPDLARMLWDLQAALTWTPPALGGRLELSVGGVHQTHPDLYADPVAWAGSTPWVFVERLPEVGWSWRVAEGRLAGLPLAATFSATGARLVEARWGPAGEVIGGEPLQREEGLRLTAQPRLELGPIGWGWVRLRAAGSLWTAWYDTGQRQAAWLGETEARWQLAPGASLSARLDAVRPTLLPGDGPAGSPFRFDERKLEDWVTVRAAVGEGAPAGVVVQARYLATEASWRELTVDARAGRTGPVTAGLYSLYEPWQRRWSRVVAWAELQGEGRHAGAAVRLRPHDRVVDEVAARWGWQAAPGWQVQLGAAYQPFSRQLTRYDVSLAARVAPEWALTVAASFDRSLGGLQRAELSVAWDQDCRTVAVRYDHQQQAVALLYQIRGFGEPLAGPAPSTGRELFVPEAWSGLLDRLQRGL